MTISLPWFLLLLVTYLAIAVTAIVLGIRLLPPQRNRYVGWSFLEIVLVVFLYILWPSFGFVVVKESGLGDTLYGKEIMEAAASTEKREGSTLARQQVGMLAGLIAFPLQVASILLVLWHLSDVRPYQLGFTRTRWERDVLLGFMGWLLLTPPVLLLNWAVSEAITMSESEGVKEHPFMVLKSNEVLGEWEFGLLVFLAVVAAPVLEELIFRGVLLRWLSVRSWGSTYAMGLCLLISFPYGHLQWDDIRASPVTLLGPPVFVLLMIGGHYAVRARQQSDAPAAIWSSSLLFGMIHNFAWPSPIPLFVLALGLGWLAHRTQSLIGPMVLHSLFNAVACVQLLFT